MTSHSLFAGTLLAISTCTTVFAYELTSPDGRVKADIQVKTTPTATNELVYSLSYNDRPVLTDSALGLVFGGNIAPLCAKLLVMSADREHHDRTWRPVCGEKASLRDAYNELTLRMREESPPNRLLDLRCRAYDEGFAIRYEMPAQPGIDQVTITDEKTEFRFTGDYTAWATYAAQGEYACVKLSQIKPGCERPLTVRVADDLYAAVAEARLVDFCRMKLAPLKGAPHALVADLDKSGAKMALPFTTPWRVIMLADSPASLLERNGLILNLNDPCAIKDTSWIKPGKVIREVTLTTAGGLACVDFAAAHNLQYVEFDAGWYGHEYHDASDATTVTVDPARSKGPLDLPGIIAHANQKGVGILLYVNRRALERQLDAILPLFRQWGIKGVKYGFVQVGSQQWTSWLHAAVRKAAENQLMVDIHDEYRPTGYSRTYPNLMTQEGIRGDETKPSNRLTLTILFTRMLAGAGDNTVCYFDSRVDQNANHAYQLAKAVCLFSPWQFLYWYDRPPLPHDATPPYTTPNHIIGDEPELEFYDAMPTVWDDTRVLDGRIGEYAVIARRSGNDWFVGCMNAEQPRNLELPLDFLPRSRPFSAARYANDPAVKTRTHVAIERSTVTRDTVLKIELGKNDGLALWLTPATAGQAPR